MNKSSLSLRLARISFVAVSAIALVLGFIAWQILSARIRRDANAEAARLTSQTLSTLSGIDQLTSAQVETGMRILKQEGKHQGAASLKGTATVGGREVPDLHFGSESQTANYAVVDHCKELAGGTATLFVWNGADFIRVSTNVMKPDGSRAIGTTLDRTGRAFAALTAGREFHGVVDILGSPYTTSYVPMLDENGKMVGAWYTGYRLDSIATLGKSLEDTHLLDHGFVALMKPTGAVIFHSKSISDADLESVKTQQQGWRTQQQVYPAWGYSILAAYPEADIRKQLLQVSAILAAAIALLVGVVVVLQVVLLKRLVIAPILGLSEQMFNANLSSQMASDRTDEIGTLGESFNHFVTGLREALLHVRDGSSASTAKSSEIREVSSATVSRMSEQLRCAEDASAAMTDLSRRIADTASHTDEALERARAAAEAAREGGELVASTAAMVHDLAEGTEQSASRVSNLNQRVQQISSIVGVIEEIASGTNLLALNASIEAARAGEQGRGFAVVAGEVRRLAERTSQATQQVSSLISGIEAETAEAATGILSASSNAKRSAEAIVGLNQQFVQISQLVVEVDGRIGHIAASAREEASAANSVSDTMHVVASSAKESASGAGQVVEASDELLEIAEKLENMVGNFQM